MVAGMIKKDGSCYAVLDHTIDIGPAKLKRILKAEIRFRFYSKYDKLIFEFTGKQLSAEQCKSLIAKIRKYKNSKVCFAIDQEYAEFELFTSKGALKHAIDHVMKYN